MYILNILKFSTMGWRIFTFIIFVFLVILPTLMSPTPIKVSGPVSNDNIQYCVQNDYTKVDFLQVSNLYDFLNEEGFFTGKIERHMTTSLQFAIKNFQRFAGIRVDGIIGPSTHKAMTSFNNCTKSIEAELINCSGYLAYLSLIHI